MQEQWKPAAEFEDFYEVSNYGFIRNKRSGKVLKPFRTVIRERVVGLSRPGLRKRFLVHRLVVASFLGPIPDGMEVNHKDGDRGNNRLDNLEVCTRKQNAAHHWKRFWASKMGITEVCSALESA